MKNPGRKLIACMKRFNCAVAILLTYVLCASALLQPVSVYAASAAGDGAGSVATAQSNSSEETDESADQPEGQGGEEQEASVQEDQNESQITDSDDVSGDAETTDQDSSASEESEADDSAASYKANSWRYIDGELRNDIRDDNASEANFYGRAMHRMPDGATAQGIDVSGLQGDIDWQKVKDAGIDYAIIKIGSRDNNGWWTDSRFLRNVSECERLGIPWGAYVYSYARNATEATEEADFAISKLSGHHPTLPIYFDLEETPKEGESIKWLPYTDSAAMASIAKAFCNRISSAGYKPGIYASAGWFKYYLTDPCFSNSGWSIWTAQYWYDSYNASLGLAPEYPAKFDCWQYSYRGSIPGISSNVDVNYCYGDYLKSDSSDTDDVTAAPHASVTAHVSSVGWLGTVSDGATAGTTGRSLSLEAVKVSLSNAEASGSIEVNAHVSGIGWQGWDEPSASEGGTTGQSRSIEALQFRLTGEMAGLYDVYYRVHASNIGWMGWAKDGEDAGTTGYGRKLEAVQVRLVRKGDPAPSADGSDVDYAFKKKPMCVSYRAHVAGIGWQAPVEDGATAGTTGRGRALEDLMVSLSSSDYSDGSSVQVDAHVSGIGWQGWEEPSPSEGGTTGQARAVEAVRLRLTGELADDYDVWYRVHASGIGWMGWAKDGEDAGTTGYGRKLEAVQVRLVRKGDPAPSADGSDVDYAFKKKPMCVSYRAHVAGIGWQAPVEDGATAGTTGRGRALEDLMVSLSSSDYSDGSSVQVDAHVSGIGWQGWEEPSPSEGGTTGQARAVEAVRLRLTGELADDYDVWYRVHASGIGWMGWAKDGEDAGTTGMACPVEAVQIKLVKKGGSAPGSTQTPSLTLPSISYSSFSGSNWQGDVGQNSISGTVGQATPIHGFKAQISSAVAGSIQYRSHLSNIGWTDYVSDGALSGLNNTSESIQAVQIQLTGDLSKYFDITYRVHVDNIGWLGWAKNGAPAGTTSCGLNIQAVQIAIRRKGTVTSETAYYSRQADLPYIGFQNPGQYYQVSNRSVSIKNQGYGIFGYRTESRIPYNATRNDCINAMITRAYDYVGTTPYIWDYSCAPGVGVDCAGLVMQSLYATGMNLGRYNPWDHYYTPGHNHYANDMWNDPRFLHLSFSQRRIGDLVCYNGHIAIYIGNDQIIEAASPKVGVRVHSVYVGYAIKGVLRPFV